MFGTQRLIARPRLALLVLGALALALAAAGAAAGQSPTRLVPIGASYQTETLESFAAAAAEHDSDGTVVIRVLPITYGRDAYRIGGQYRRENLELAAERAAQIEDACRDVVSGATTCEATVVDMQIRSDAMDPAKAAELWPGVDGVYILGGDQQIAMLVIANTPAEQALADAFADGAAIGGNSAGAAVLSRYMIGGYTGDNYAWHGLHQGAVDLWYGADDSDRRGLIFGLQEAIIDQHVLERGRTARLLQAMVEKPGDKLAVGVDWGTAATIDESLIVRDVAGWYAAVVLDGETYGSAAAADYVGADPAILDIHDVAYHILPEGDYAFDLATRQPWVGGAPQAAPDISGRGFDQLLPPAGAGTLFLGGDLGRQTRGEAMQAFVDAAEATGGRTVVLVSARTQTGATGQARYWRNRLTSLGLSRPTIATLTDGTDPAALAAALDGASAIFFTGREQNDTARHVALLQAAGLDDWLRDWWHAGGVLMMDRAAAAAAGPWMSAEPTPTGSNVEYQSSDTFIDGYLYIEPGLGLVDAVIEPRVLYDYLYGRLVSHVAAHPETVAIGIERGTALRLTPDGVDVIGTEAALAVDGRYAQTLDVGDNDVFAATWLLLDTFPTGTSLTD